MSEEMHTELRINDHSEVGFGYQLRRAAAKKPDGTFRVTEQKRSGSDIINKVCVAIVTVGVRIPRTIKWRNDFIIREYATQEEAKKLLNDFDEAIRKKQVEQKLKHIPEEDRARYAKEKGLNL